jgi:hypothetical protein
MKQLMDASQDGSREFITFIAIICADGSRISSALIYKSESGAIQDIWLDDFDEEKEIAHFAVTQKGWSNENAELYWLKYVFDRYTKAKVDNHRRLLIVDNYNSHLNMRFINYANQNRILFAFLPPHSTHRLQSLDVGLFGFLAQYYTQEIDRFMTEIQGLVNIIKRYFWNFFIQVYTRAFTAQNIRFNWKITGIYFFDFQCIFVRIIKRKRKSEVQNSSLSMPGSARVLRRTYGRLHAEGYVDNEAAILVRAGEKLAAENKILRKENEGLRDAIFEEKRKRKRGKSLNF